MQNTETKKKMVDMKAPQSKQAPQQAPKGKPSGATVQQKSAIAIALEAEKHAQVTVAQARRALRDSAAAYYNSGFDPNALPKNPDVANAVKDLAKDMQKADEYVWGDYYVDPTCSDVTTLQLQPTGFDAVAYFHTPQRQLAGGV
jgi:hypothetical protein